MSTWTEGSQNAIEYVEKNQTENLKIKNIVAKAYVLEFHFQRVFLVFCGFSASEYICNRRLTLVARELAGSEIFCGMFGRCIDSNGLNFNYLIAVDDLFLCSNTIL